MKLWNHHQENDTTWVAELKLTSYETHNFNQLQNSVAELLKTKDMITPFFSAPNFMSFFFPIPNSWQQKKKCDDHHLPWKNISKKTPMNPSYDPMTIFKIVIPKSFGPGDCTTNFHVLKQCIWVFQTFPPRGSYVLSAADVGGWTWGNGEVNKKCFVENAYKIDVYKDMFCFSKKNISLQNIKLFHLIDTWPWFFWSKFKFPLLHWSMQWWLASIH